MTVYRYSIELRRDSDGTALLQAPLTPDWSAALEWVHFCGARRGLLPPVMADGSGTVEPIWHPELSAPYVAAFRAVIAIAAGEVACEIPRAYVRRHAQAAAEALVDRGVLQSGEMFQYIVSAFPAAPEVIVSASSASFSVEAIDQPLPLHDAALADFARGAVESPPLTEGDVPVFIPQAVLDDVKDHAQRSGDVESGGVLLGTLHRDAALPEIFVEVTAFIPARHTESTSTTLTFTAETWAAVRTALALRRRNETMVGWAHHHPDWCRLRQCPLERRKQCTATNAFYSAEDILLMATVFPRAFHVGLLLSESHAGFTTSMFGWRQGMVAHRGYYTTKCRVFSV
jgi:hypothetical protein